MGGSLTLQSVEGKGSVFSFTIPVGDYLSETLPKSRCVEFESEDSEKDELSYSFEGEALVAEDARTNQVFIKRLLEKFGLNVTIVENGSEAVQKTLSRNYDIIFMDIQMPKMNGYEATVLLEKTR